MKSLFNLPIEDLIKVFNDKLLKKQFDSEGEIYRAIILSYLHNGVDEFRSKQLLKAYNIKDLNIKKYRTQIDAYLSIIGMDTNKKYTSQDYLNIIKKQYHLKYITKNEAIKYILNLEYDCKFTSHQETIDTLKCEHLENYYLKQLISFQNV